MPQQSITANEIIPSRILKGSFAANIVILVNIATIFLSILALIEGDSFESGSVMSDLLLTS